MIDQEWLKKFIEDIDWHKLPDNYQIFTDKPLEVLGDGITNPPSKIILPDSVPREGLNEFVDLRVESVATTLSLLLFQNYLNIGNLEGEVIDFGSGVGASAHVLRQYGGNVVGLELSDILIKQVIEQGILTPENAIVGDGFKYLDEKVNPASIDLVAAFRITKDFPIQKIYDASKRIFKPGGQLLITGQTDAKSLMEEYEHLGQIKQGLHEDSIIYTHQ